MAFEERSALFGLASLVVWHGLTPADHRLMLISDEGTGPGAQVASDEGSRKDGEISVAHRAFSPSFFVRVIAAWYTRRTSRTACMDLPARLIAQNDA